MRLVQSRLNFDVNQLKKIIITIVNNIGLTETRQNGLLPLAMLELEYVST